MKIRNKILFYFSSTVIVLSAISLALIYILFYACREEEFQQQQNEKIKYTVGLVNEFKQMSEELAHLLDAQDIHDFYDEKLLIYNSQKQLIFASMDSLPIVKVNQILNELSPAKQWIETKEGHYDLIGIYTEHKGQSYYGVSKAYDLSGYSKLYFLRNVLIAIFIAITIIVILLSIYLSNIITKPITELAEKLNKYDLRKEEMSLIETDTSSFELQYLTERFNELLGRTNEAFAFQKNAINHISHELKTPITILVSELEKIKTYTNKEKRDVVLDKLTTQAKSLGEIINVLLEISKIESGQQIAKETVRIDELLFDTIAELKSIYPNFDFELNYFPNEFDEERLFIDGNTMLVKQLFQNLLLNCISYGSENKARIKIDCSLSHQLRISIENKGEPVSKEEQKYLFDRSFRGKNSEGKIGFGLGLVLSRKITSVHQAEILYRNSADGMNIFEVVFKKGLS